MSETSDRAVAEFREGFTKLLDEFTLGPIARRAITDGVAAVVAEFAAELEKRGDEIKRLRAEAKRCNAIGHPSVTPSSLIPCQLDRGHDGPHYSSSGCPGSAVTWTLVGVAQ